MEDLSLLGNAAAVPIVVAITQLLKKNFPGKFKRKADVISLSVSVVVCFGWWFYNTPSAEIAAHYNAGWIVMGKGFITHLVVSFATWLSASKSYDLFLGEKKRAKELDNHLVEKEKLRVELEAVKNGSGKSAPQPVEEDEDLAEKLRAILEGRD